MRWCSAQGESKKAKELLQSYYARLLPFWPAQGQRILPNDASVLAAFSRRLSPEEIAELGRLGQAVLPKGVARVTASLVALILASALLRARGQLSVEGDPAEPLLALFEAGYELNPGHGSVDLLHASGMTSIPLPTRDAVAARRDPRPA